MFSHQILRTIISEIQQNEFYAVTADGTQDVAGQVQESFVLRHVDSDLYVHEDFIGLYEIPSTTGDVLARTLFDVLSRNGLSIMMVPLMKRYGKYKAIFLAICESIDDEYLQRYSESHISPSGKYPPGKFNFLLSYEQ